MSAASVVSYEFDVKCKGHRETLFVPATSTVSQLTSAVLRTFNLSSAKLIGLANARRGARHVPPSAHALLSTLSLPSSRPIKLILVAQTQQQQAVDEPPAPPSDFFANFIATDVAVVLLRPFLKLKYIIQLFPTQRAVYNHFIIKPLIINDPIDIHSSSQLLYRTSVSVPFAISSIRFLLQVYPQISMFSSHLITLHFSNINYYPQSRSLSVGILPATLIDLSMGLYNGYIARNVLPNGLLTLKMSYQYDQPIDVGVLPAGLTDLDLGNAFNQRLLPNRWPTALRRLAFGTHNYRFNHKLDASILTPSLTTLELSDAYDRLVPTLLPPSLTKLRYSQQLSNGLLPPAITELQLSPYYRIPNGALPPALTALSFRSRMFGTVGQFTFARGALETLEKKELLNSRALRALASEHVDINTLAAMWPPSLTKLELGSLYKHPIPPDSLPPSLTALDLGIGNTHTLAPHTLPALLDLRFVNQRLVTGLLPSSLTRLYYDSSDDIPDNTLPQSLTHLTFGSRFDWQLSINCLPKSLKTLVFDSPLPEGELDSESMMDLNIYLQFRLMCRGFNRQIIPGSFPSSLTAITFGVSFNQHLTIDCLPLSINCIIINNTDYAYYIPECYKDVTTIRRV